jgi:hypothetical protein
LPITGAERSVRHFAFQAAERTYRFAVKKLLPAKAHTFVRAYADLKVNTFKLHGWGGAFTGQIKRQELFSAIMSAFPFQAIVETGTYLGYTTEFFAQFGVPVFTAECQLYEYYFSSLRLRRQKNVHTYYGDSREFLNRLKKNPQFPRKHIVFYLDAHWFDQFPLGEEFDIIRNDWTESVIIVDDFKIPDDDGYEYDDYGPGKVICLDYLKNHGLGDFQAFFPAVSSAEETGMKRGCAVFVTKDDLLGKMETLIGLRKV